MEYAAAIFFLLIFNVAIGLFFAWRELPSLRSQLEFERAMHSATLRVAWAERKAESDSRASGGKRKAQERSERLREREAKRNAREKILNEYQLRKQIRKSKVEENQTSRDKRLVLKNKPSGSED